MNDVLIILLLLCLLIGTFVGGGFFFGRKYERVKMLRIIPDAMEKTCNDCWEVGKKDGYKKGIKTCDDVLASIDAQGRY